MAWMEPASPDRSSTAEVAAVRLTAELRLTAGLLALAFAVIAGASLPMPVRILLAGYAGFGIMVMSFAHGSVAAPILVSACWIDLAFLGVALFYPAALPGVLPLLFLVPTAVAALEFGFRAGACVAAVAAALLAVGLIAAATPAAAALSGFAALAIGALIARWAEAARRLAQRLATESALFDALCIADRPEAIAFEAARRMRAHVGASSAFLLLAGDGTEAHASSASSSDLSEEDSAALRARLAKLDAASIYVHRRDGSLSIDRCFDATSLRVLATAGGDAGEAGVMAHLLHADSLIALPLPLGRPVRGWLILAGGDFHASAGDARFLMRLLGRVADVAAARIEQERSVHALRVDRGRISGDLHDSTLQPYIGLKMGLEAVQRKLLPGDPLARDLAELTSMTAESIEELRAYLGSLRAPQSGMGAQASLLATVKREAARFHRHHGMDVTVRAEDPELTELDLRPGMAAEIGHMVREALSNVRRHTASERALIGLRQQDRRLVMEFVNDADPQGSASFLPRSLAERASHLGGHLRVHRRPEGRTEVKIEVPV